jgi:UDP-2,3-diacylglucosamine pyrophosphatase LpxH
MSEDQRGMPPRELRTLFLSDLHLGSRFCRADALLELLCRVQPEQIYLVGDILDSWRLKRYWRWPKVYDEIVHRLLELSREGTRVLYLPGNHDQFLRRFLDHWGRFEVRDSVVHRCADGRRLLVLHGDQFDRSEQRFPVLSIVGASLYEGLLACDQALNWCLGGLGMRRRRFSASLKAAVKNRVKRASNFESSLLKSMLAHGCAGVVCGHIHQPRLLDTGTMIYANTGDWIESCTAVVELPSGELQLWGGTPQEWVRGDASCIAQLPSLPGRGESGDQATARREISRDSMARVEAMCTVD